MAEQRRTQADPGRVSKQELISRVARRSEATIAVTSVVYAALIEELVEIVTSGEAVVLTGFGRFYRQQHRGHKVRFGQSDISDYAVLKFSASKSLNRKLDSAEGLREAGPDEAA